MHWQKYGMKAEDNANLFVYLADSQLKRITWSACGRLPTFRTSSGKMYHCKTNVWLTGRCKLASLGFPVTKDTAAAMSVPQMEVTDCSRADRVAGNSFQFATAAVVQLVALSCFRKLTD
jgi:hypothetical protein